MWIMLTWVLSLTIQDKHFASINQIILRWKVTKIMFNFHTLKCVRRVGGGRFRPELASSSEFGKTSSSQKGSSLRQELKLNSTSNFYFNILPLPPFISKVLGGGNLDFNPPLNLVKFIGGY